MDRRLEGHAAKAAALPDPPPDALSASACGGSKARGDATRRHAATLASFPAARGHRTTRPSGVRATGSARRPGISALPAVHRTTRGAATPAAAAAPLHTNATEILPR